MKDIANQLVLKWARKDPEEPIQPTDDFTRLTLDTIALCTMNYRFNSFYQEGLHPFVEAMMRDLLLASKTSTQTAVIAAVMKWWANPKENNALMRRIGQEIIDDRRANPVEKDDFLNALLYNKDPRTGKSMRDDLIISNMLTFLVAGHETTSGLLSFAVHGLLRNPEAYRKAQEEVDTVIGDAKVEVHHLRKLKYLDAVFKETLRLHATAPALSKMINPEWGVEVAPIFGGKYQVFKSDRILLLLAKAMQDPKVFGDDADQFRPDRMMEGNPEFEKYQQYWKVSSMPMPFIFSSVKC
jgi:cytochrome P450 / NADPH-cytochrome P450 reductase